MVHVVVTCTTSVELHCASYTGGYHMHPCLQVYILSSFQLLLPILANSNSEEVNGHLVMISVKPFNTSHSREVIVIKGNHCSIIDVYLKELTVISLHVSSHLTFAFCSQ